MDALILFIIFGIIGLTIMYAVIRLAVCHGILDARRREAQQTHKEPSISKVTCANCGSEYDMDYPKCPDCSTSGDSQYNS